MIRRLSALYPTMLAKMSGDQIETMIEAWTDALSAYDLETVERAVKNLSKTSRFFPSLPELMTEVERVRSLQTAEAWFMGNAELVQGDAMKDPEYAAWYRELFWTQFAGKVKQT